MGTQPVSSLPCRKRILALAVEIYAKTDIKVFRLCLALLAFLVFPKIQVKAREDGRHNARIKQYMGFWWLADQL